MKDGALSLFSCLLAVRSREVAASGRLYITFDFQSAADQVWPIVKTNAAQARAPPPPPDPIDQLDRNEALAAPRKRRSGGVHYITPLGDQAFKKRKKGPPKRDTRQRDRSESSADSVSAISSAKPDHDEHCVDLIQDDGSAPPHLRNQTMTSIAWI